MSNPNGRAVEIGRVLGSWVLCFIFVIVCLDFGVLCERGPLGLVGLGQRYSKL
jgi:hypothetical protein